MTGDVKVRSITADGVALYRNRQSATRGLHQRWSAILHVPKPKVKIAKAVGRIFRSLVHVVSRHFSDAFSEKWSMVALKKQAQDDRNHIWYRRFWRGRHAPARCGHHLRAGRRNRFAASCTRLRSDCFTTSMLAS